MNEFVQFDDVLTSFVDNAWLDDGVILAGRILNSFEPEDWLRLASQWSQRDVRWQCSAAYVLSDAPPDRCIPLLMEMVRSGSQELQFNASDALRSVLQSGAQTLEVNQSFIANIENLLQKSSGLMKGSLVELQTHLILSDK